MNPVDREKFPLREGWCWVWYDYAWLPGYFEGLRESGLCHFWTILDTRRVPISQIRLKFNAFADPFALGTGLRGADWLVPVQPTDPPKGLHFRDCPANRDPERACTCRKSSAESPVPDRP